MPAISALLCCCSPIFQPRTLPLGRSATRARLTASMLRSLSVPPLPPRPPQVCSKRAFDGQIKKWRRMLHEWDLPEDAEQQVRNILLQGCCWWERVG